MVNKETICPDCRRLEAESVEDVLRGHCPKWWAYRDAEAEKDCESNQRLFIKDREIINQIRSIRAKNNNPWMEILLIALENDREKTMVCARRILKNDASINKLLKELIEKEE